MSGSRRRFVDLHTHSTASDGQLRPAELIALAERKHLAMVALTDHDTMDGLAEARAAAAGFPGLRFVGGIEVSARFPTGTLHILGLGVDERSPAIASLCRQLVAARDSRNPRIIARLRELGIAIEMEDVRAVAGHGRIVGRLHIAEALRRKGHVKTTQEAFDTLIGNGRAAYVDKERLWPRQAIEAIRAGGGVAALAHPPQLRCANRAELERVLRSLIRDGLGGIEVYHSENTPEQTRLYLDLARRFRLAVTGGSDFHGPAKPEARLGIPRVPLAAIAERIAFPRAGGDAKGRVT
ncbi:MAG: PHP domain-containing protein [Phycisphaerae bacterium]